MHEQVRQLLKDGIIEESNSAWSSPVVMVRKSTDKYRMCIDYRKVNAVTHVDSYPLPRMDTVLRKLQRAMYISTIDLSSAYHQIHVKNESRPLPAFSVPGMGLYQYLRLPFGLAGAPEDD